MRGLELFIKSARKGPRNCLWKSLSHIPEWLRRNDAIWKCHLKIDILEGSGQVWSSIYFFPHCSHPGGRADWGQDHHSSVFLRQILLSYCKKYSRNGLQINESFSYYEEVKPGRPQMAVLESDRLNTERFGGHGLCTLREPTSKIEWQRVDTCGEWTAGNLAELGHRMTKREQIWGTAC